MPSVRMTKIAGVECKVVSRMPLYTWSCSGKFQGQPIETSGFATEQEAYQAWKAAAENLARQLQAKAAAESP